MRSLWQESLQQYPGPNLLAFTHIEATGRAGCLCFGEEQREQNSWKHESMYKETPVHFTSGFQVTYSVTVGGSYSPDEKAEGSLGECPSHSKPQWHPLTPTSPGQLQLPPRQCEASLGPACRRGLTSLLSNPSSEGIRTPEPYEILLPSLSGISQLPGLRIRI